MFTDQPMVEKTSLPSNIIEEHSNNLLLMINLYENILQNFKTKNYHMFTTFYKIEILTFIFLDFAFKTLKYYNHLIVVDA